MTKLPDDVVREIEKAAIEYADKRKEKFPEQNPGQFDNDSLIWRLGAEFGYRMAMDRCVREVENKDVT